MFLFATDRTQIDIILRYTQSSVWLSVTKVM